MICSIHIPLIQEYDVFGFFMMLALVFFGSCFLYILHLKKHVPLWKVVSVYYVTVLFMITGAKLAAIDMHEWDLFFRTGEFPDHGRMTVLGVLVFFVPGLLLGKSLFKVQVSFLDELTIPALLALAIQRLGCFFAGCCNGIPTGNSYGVNYAPFTHAHNYCAAHGHFEYIDSYTPALHPVPLYLILVSIISAILLWKFGKYIKRIGNRFITGMLLYFVGRLFIEFWRTPYEEGLFSFTALGLKGIQWMEMGFVILLTTVLIYREYYYPKNQAVIKFIRFDNRPMALMHGFAYASLFAFIYLLFRSHYTFSQTMVLDIFMCLMGIVYLIFFSKKVVPQYHSMVLAACIVFVGLVIPLLAQQVRDRVSKIAVTDTVFPSSYKEMTFGSGGYSFLHYHSGAHIVPSSGSGCSGSNGYKSMTYPKKYQHNQFIGALGIAKYTRIDKYYSNYIKLFLIGGTDNNVSANLVDGKKTEWIYNFEGTAGFEERYFGLGIKMNVGRFRRIDIKTGYRENSLSAGPPLLSMAFPAINARIGQMENCYFDFRTGTSLFGLNTNMNYPRMYGLGTGIGENDGRYMRMNIGGTRQIRMVEAAAKFKLEKNSAVELIWMSHSRRDQSNNKGNCFCIAFCYMFDQKSEKIKK